MLTPRRKGSDYHHGSLYESAVLAGKKIIERGGVNALGIRKIADQLHVTPASLYRHFESLEQLQSAIAAEVRDEIAELMISRREKVKVNNAAEKMYAIGSGYIEYAELNPRLFEVAFLTCDSAVPTPQSDKSWNVLIDGINNFKKPLPPGIEYLLWSVVHGFATLVAQNAIEPKDIKVRKKEVLDGIGRLLK